MPDNFWGRDRNHQNHRPIAANDPQFAALVEATARLSRLAGISAPQLYVAELKPRARWLLQNLTGFPFQSTYFLSGNVLRVSSTIRLLSSQAVEGIVAHEIGHRLQPDFRKKGLLWGAFAYLLTALLLIGPLVLLRNPRWNDIQPQLSICALAFLVPMAVQGYREELDADRRGAQLLGSAEPLKVALREVDPKGCQPPLFLAVIRGWANMHPSTLMRLGKLARFQDRNPMAG